jgi:DNA replication protein DnaC
LNKGIPVLFVNVPDLLDYLRGAYNPNAEETYDERFNEVRDAAILVLDDLGTQNATPWAEEKLYQIFNTRYVHKRPTVITTNLDLDDLDPRLRSRLNDLDLVRKLSIRAPDYRRSAIEQGQSSMSTLALYHDKRFDNFDVRGDLTRDQQANLKEALRNARDFAQQPQDWLVFNGDHGVGKTHLAAAIANYQAERGYPAMFVVVPDLLDHLRAAFSPDSRVSFDQRFEEVRTTPLLVLDDLGTESSTPWAREKLYQILNHRYVSRLPTVMTMSVSTDELEPRIRTRVQDMTRCLVFPIDVPSYRGGHDTRPTLPKLTRTTRSKR